MVPAVAVYLISCPPILTECLVWTTFSSGFFSSFALSALSPDFSVDFSAGFSSGFCALARAAMSIIRIPAMINRLGLGIETIPQNAQLTALGILCDSQRSVNLPLAARPVFVKSTFASAISFAIAAQVTQIRQKFYEPEISQ